MKRNSLKFLIGGILIAIVIISVFVSVGSDNMTYYHTPEEVLAEPAKYINKKIRVMGLVEKGSIQWDSSITRLDFKISDDSNRIMMVRYHGAKPDMFREGQGVVVEGSLQKGNYLAATVLLVKHNEEYKVSEHAESKESYIKTMDL